MSLRKKGIEGKENFIINFDFNDLWCRDPCHSILWCNMIQPSPLIGSALCIIATVDYEFLFAFLKAVIKGKFYLLIRKNKTIFLSWEKFCCTLKRPTHLLIYFLLQLVQKKMLEPFMFCNTTSQDLWKS